MSIRNVSLAVCLPMAASAIFAQATSGARYVVEITPNSAGTRFQGFSADANSQNPVFDSIADPTPLAGVTQMIAKPDGSKFYVLSSAGIQSIDPAFSSTSFKPINGVTGTLNAMAISPNGKYLYVSSSSGLFILDTSTDSVLSNTVPITGNSVAGVVFSADSQNAYLLTNAALGSAIHQVNTSTRAQVGQPLTLPYGCDVNAAGQPLCAITMSPLQTIHVTNGGYIYEINPSTLSVTNTITTNVSTLGPLRYTPDGSFAYAVNLTPSIGGRAMVQVNLSAHTFAELNYANSGVTPPTFSDVFPASASQIFAVTTSDAGQSSPTTLYDVAPSPFAAAPSTSLAALGPAVLGNVLSATLSNEQAGARYLYLLVANGNQTNLDKVDLASGTIVLTTLAIIGNGVLEFVNVPPQTGAANFVQFNNNQTVTANATSAPMGVVVVNSAGIPVYNVQVSYTVDPSTGVTINGGNQTTNKDGYASATATMPATSGTYTVTVTAGSATATFTLTVPGAGTPSGGGSSQVTIVGGNGLLLQGLQDRSPIYDPLTIKVVDTSGNPLSGVPVTFAALSGPGGTIDNPSTTTDQNGLASTDFLPSIPQQGLPFQAIDINASTPYGSVDFVETTFQTQFNPSGPSTGAPQISIVQPTENQGFVITAGEGDVVPNAIVASIFSSLTPTQPIPNVGIRLAQGNDITQLAPATCQGSTLSDQNGLAHCNLVVSCKAGVNTLIPILIDVGDQRNFSYTINVVKGSTQTLTIAGGNNQTGNVGQPLGQVLLATVTDNCGAPVPGAQVTWKVTGGSATLANTISTSDAGGHVSTKVVLGSIPGAITVTATVGTSTVTFTATNNVTVGGITLLSGGGQTALEGAGFAQPLVFAVKDINGNPVPGVQVNFSVVGGTAALGAASATTNASGQASVTVTAGATPGTVTIQASYSTFAATASLTVQPPGPVLTSASFTNSASGKTGLVACGIATATGSGLASGVSGTLLGNPLNPLGGPLPYTLSGLSLSVNGIPAPIYWISNSNGAQQVTFQTPCETAVGSATVAVTTGAGTVSSATTIVTGVQVFAAQPGIFTYLGPNSTLFGAIIRPDGSYVSPSNFAQRGETDYLVATGLGLPAPMPKTGSTGNGQTLPVNQVLVGVGGNGLPVVSVQYVPGAIGVYYVGFQLSNPNLKPGPNQPLALWVCTAGCGTSNPQYAMDNQGALFPGVQ